MNGLGKEIPALPAAWTVSVGEESAGQRLDNFLARLLRGVPRTHIYRIVRSGEVRVNRGRVDPAHRLCEGDRVRIPPLRAGDGRGRRGGPVPPVGLPVLYEDEWLLAVDKPAGLAVHGGSGVAHGLIERMRAARAGTGTLELVHRLDRETSGALLIAKKRAALVGLHAAMREGRIHKRYLALVRGEWPPARRDVRLPLARYLTGEGERRVRVDGAAGADAHTAVRVQRTWHGALGRLSLVEAELRTGRTHQIRVHLAHLGHVIAGDDKYGDFEWNRALARRGLKRMFLHAQRIAFDHPVTGAPVSIVAPLPAELAGFVAALDDEAEAGR